MRCTSYDLLNRKVVDDIPFTTYRFSPTHCTLGPGGWSATIPDGDEKASPEFLAAERHAVIFTADADDARFASPGRILFAGILWDVEDDTDSGMLRVGGAGPWSYFRDGRRNFRGIPPVTNVTEAADFSYENAPDQFNLVLFLMVLAQSGTAENLGIDTRFPALSGVTRTGVLKASELKSYADIIEDWAFADDGFDFDISGEWVGSEPRFHLNLHHPEQGVDLSDPWYIGSHVTIDGKWKRESGANLVDAVGATVDTEPLRRSAVAAPTRGLRLERVISYTDVTSGPVLKGLANGELRRANRPVGEFDVVLNDLSVCSLDSWSVGDTVPLVGPVGNYTDIDQRHRIMGYEFSSGEDTETQVTVNLEPAP